MIRFFTLASIALLIAVGIYLGFPAGSAQKADNTVPIGGDFSLTSHLGQTVTNDSLLGKKRLMYFGFTYCPEICPTGLQVIETALETLGDDAPTAFFVTVDPERDTVEQLAIYMQNFPAVTGLTGSPEEIKQTAQTFRIYYKKIENPESPEDYTMDHTSLIYLLDEQGRYLTHFPHNIAPDAMVSGIRNYLTKG